jgi:hypothetical protein
MGGLAPGLGPVRGYPWPITGPCDHISLGGVWCGRCSRAVTRGLEICTLDGVSTRSFTVFRVWIFCMGPMYWIFGWGRPRESIPGAAHW